MAPKTWERSPFPMALTLLGVAFSTVLKSPKTSPSPFNENIDNRPKEKPNKCVAISAGDLGVCLPKASQKPDGWQRQVTHPPLPTTREQGPGAGRSEKLDLPREGLLPGVLYTAASATAHRQPPGSLLSRQIEAPAQVGSVRLLGPSPSLPTTKPLTLASASCCWELRSPTLPLMVPVGAWLCHWWCSWAPGFAGYVRCLSRPDGRGLASPRPVPPGSPPLWGFCQGQSPRRTLPGARRCHFPSQSTDFSWGKQAPPPRIPRAPTGSA